MISSLVDGCRRFVCAIISGLFHCLAGIIFGLLQRINPCDPITRCGQLQNRQSSVVRARVLWARKGILLAPSSVHDFLLWSRAELWPLDVLLSGNMSLYCLSPDFTVFVRTPEDVNLYSSEKSPFFYLLQFVHAKEVYVTSHHWFHILASEVAEDCGVLVTWLSSTGRCGSTMLSQVMEGVPGTITICEPDAVENIAFMDNMGLITQEQTLALLHSTLQVLTHHAITQVTSCSKRPMHVFMKGRAECTHLVRQMKQVCPHIRHVFMYRRLAPMIFSFRQMVQSHMPLWTRVIDIDTVAAFVPHFRQNFFINLCLGDRRLLEDVVTSLTMFGLIAVKVCMQLKHVQNLQADGFSIPALLYEDVLANATSVVGSLFDHLHIPRQYLLTALLAMDTHSQIALPSLAGSDHMGMHHVTARERQDLDTVLDILELPRDEASVFQHRIGLEH